MSNIGEKIKELRLEKKVTQKEIAEAIGVSPVSVQRFEYGSVRPSLDTLVALAEYFDVPLDFLMGHTGTNLTGANLKRTDMRDVKACGAIFVRANLEQADLRNADLRFADFSHASLRNAKLDGAKIGGALFTGADVTGTVLDGKVET